ncbi:MAG: PEGA domain-containing protein [Planctomycetales bacterium]|nr:PEGA domain-containing protein [Planctomycetales bacterium]
MTSAADYTPASPLLVFLKSSLGDVVMLEARRGRFPACTRVPAGWTLLGLAFFAVCFCGCVHRRMTVRTNPPGALLYVDDYEIGTTPVSTSFTYYGKRKIRLVKDGYETLTVMQDIPSPWYEVPPLDFVAENFVPGHIRDQRVLDYQLRPQAVVPTEQLLSRAENLRRGMHSATCTATQPPAGGVRGPAAIPPSAAPEMIPVPEGVGGQPVHPLPPR